MKICFVGHTFHQRTQSSAFFRSVLEELGEVTQLCSSPDAQGGADDDSIIEHFVSNEYDLWVFWQTEYIAERLVPLGLRNALLAPMYDGAWSRPDNFFKQFVTCRFLSWSRVMHTRLQRLDCRSALFEYWPAPNPPIERSLDPADRSGFFWERRPFEVPNARQVLRQCRVLGVKKLHLHLVPDFERDKGRSPQPRGRQRIQGVEVSTSNWFDSRADYLEASAMPLFYFAPRLIEGIGMASLEAMANGQIVVAPDRPTANQYIGHMSSGILYDPERPYDLPEMSEQTIRELSAAARSRVTFGHEDWERDRERLKSFVLDDGRRWANTDGSAHFGNRIHAALRQRRVRSAAGAANGAGAAKSEPGAAAKERAEWGSAAPGTRSNDDAAAAGPDRLGGSAEAIAWQEPKDSGKSGGGAKRVQSARSGDAS